MSSPLKSPELYAECSNILYDPEYYVNINKKMRVPDKIKLMSNNDSDMMEDPAIVAIKKVTEGTEWMRVPERICVVGGEGHIATREPPPEMKIENALMGKPHDFEQLVQLSTPPRTLRIEDTQPAFDESAKQLDRNISVEDVKAIAKPNVDMKMTESFVDYMDSDLNSQNYMHLRRRILQLSHRIDSLELDNKRRKRRDYLLYTIGALYILVRGFSWMLTRSSSRY